MKTMSRSEAEGAFRDAVQRVRVERGMTQTQVGQAGGRSQGVVSRYLKGDMRIPDDVVHHLADALGLGDEAGRVFEALPDALVKSLRARRWLPGVVPYVAADKAFQRKIDKLATKSEADAIRACIEHLENVERGLRAGLRT